MSKGMYANFDEIVDLTLMETMMLQNFYSAVYAVHHALPFLKMARGQIIVVSSIAGFDFP